jgi:endonuclease/exonuclease/phosphatase family metal-dependent hydrolase
VGTALIFSRQDGVVGPTLRIATFNIQHGLRGDAARVDIELTAKVAADLGAEVLALQEVDVGVPRSGGVDEAKEVAAATGLACVFGHAANVSAVGEYGNALLANGTIEDIDVRRLPRRRFRSETRSIILARVTTPAVPAGMTVGATHLSIHREEVLDQLRAVVAWTAARPPPWVLLGDLNLLPHDVDGVFAAAGLRPAGGDATFPASAPRIRIDHIAVGGGLEIVGTEVIDTPASDHRPLVVEARPVSP